VNRLRIAWLAIITRNRFGENAGLFAVEYFHEIAVIDFLQDIYAITTSNRAILFLLKDSTAATPQKPACVSHSMMGC